MNFTYPYAEVIAIGIISLISTVSDWHITH